MASTEVLIAFLIAGSIFAFFPGPAILYATAQTLARGRVGGVLASLGIHLGGYAHVIAAAAGLSALLHAVPALYMAAKLAGAAYLVWLGVGMIRTPGVALPAEGLLPARSGPRVFLQSVTVEVLNPKAATFYLAFLPQFVDPAAALPVWLQFVILGTTVNLMFTCADLVCVFAADALALRLRRSSSVQRWLRRAGGALLIGLGVHLAAQRT